MAIHKSKQPSRHCHKLTKKLAISDQGYGARGKTVDDILPISRRGVCRKPTMIDVRILLPFSGVIVLLACDVTYIVLTKGF